MLGSHCSWQKAWALIILTSPSSTPPTQTPASNCIRTMVKVEARLVELGIELPDVIAPKGQFYAVRHRPSRWRRCHCLFLPESACLLTQLSHQTGNYALSVRTGNLLFLGKQCKTTGNIKQCLLPLVTDRFSFLSDHTCSGAHPLAQRRHPHDRESWRGRHPGARTRGGTHHRH